MKWKYGKGITAEDITVLEPVLQKCCLDGEWIIYKTNLYLMHHPSGGSECIFASTVVELSKKIEECYGGRV